MRFLCDVSVCLIMHHPCRDLTNTGSWAHLKQLPGAAERLTVYQADLVTQVRRFHVWHTRLTPHPDVYEVKGCMRHVCYC